MATAIEEIEKIEQESAADNAKARREYVAILHDEPDAPKGKLRKLMDALEITIEGMKSDANAVIEAKRVRTKITPAEKIAGFTPVIEKASAELDAARREWRDREERLIGTLVGLGREQELAVRVNGQCEDELKELRLARPLAFAVEE